MPNICPFEKKEKEVFFRLPIFFFQEQKIFVQGTTFVQFFMYWKAKKNFGAIQKKFFLKIYLAILEKKKISKIFGSLRIFFLLYNT